MTFPKKNASLRRLWAEAGTHCSPLAPMLPMTEITMFTESGLLSPRDRRHTSRAQRGWPTPRTRSLQVSSEPTLTHTHPSPCKPSGYMGAELGVTSCNQTATPGTRARWATVPSADKEHGVLKLSRWVTGAGVQGPASWGRVWS